MRLALLMALAVMFNACASEAGNSSPGSSSNQWQPTADAGSSNDSSAQKADSGNQPQPDQQVVEVNSCVDLKVNDGIYDCQDGNPETPITADPETCAYHAEMWTSKSGKTQVLDGAKRVIATYGEFTADCIYKRHK
ncbi:MAG: hypothetical protein HY979_00800 [Candidatus Magasanikbacteria bacterium]|nr:hypothetical protein [Candidatus Magasanikbacteria bacterium]